MAGNNKIPKNLPILVMARIGIAGVHKWRCCFDLKMLLKLQRMTSKNQVIPLRRRKGKQQRGMEEPCSSFINVLTPNIFEKIQSSSSTKEARDILAKCYTRGDKVRKVKLQALRRQYELLQMEAIRD